MAAPRRVATVAPAVRRDLARLPEELRKGGLAAAALELAKTLDRGHHCDECGAAAAGPDPKEEAALVRELRACLIELAKLTPAQSGGDVLDDLAARRTARIAAASDQ